uniref:Uncharacterized protein n=1 Tax=Pipistrellus kuhlii TaxID=59472 RepID=A0A7J7ZJP6_PIPKU|nr:hypothetical protein mPipKuh1_009583 [Pipistrellus kuhlii]
MYLFQECLEELTGGLVLGKGHLEKCPEKPHKCTLTTNKVAAVSSWTSSPPEAPLSLVFISLKPPSPTSRTCDAGWIQYGGLGWPGCMKSLASSIAGGNPSLLFIAILVGLICILTPYWLVGVT